MWEYKTRSEHTDLFIPNKFLVGKKLHPLIELLPFWEKLRNLQFSHTCNEPKYVSCMVFFILHLHKLKDKFFFLIGKNDVGWELTRNKKTQIYSNICVTAYVKYFDILLFRSLPFNNSLSILLSF